ncbi:uncharacterized protein LOC115897603 [Rhinopithecus roxellana]|uniref:uncharacterized protein LOC115897603 n=1 Tax=Rhinopithecus roxellana TaxID=61622 RepID=UPI0012376362|nr:uncharacterized protein LOC115897603 [Rhinopithecus roxellana]
MTSRQLRALGKGVEGTQGKRSQRDQAGAGSFSWEGVGSRERWSRGNQKSHKEQRENGARVGAHRREVRSGQPGPGLLTDSGPGSPPSGLAGGSAQSQRAPDRVLCHSEQQQGLPRAARGSVPDHHCHCGAGRADWPDLPELDVCVEEAESEALWTWTGLCIFATLFLLSVSYSAAITLLMVQRFLSATRQGRPQTSLDYTNILQPHA